MPLYLATATVEGDEAAFALAEAVERMAPAPLEAECYDLEGMPGMVQVMASFALAPNGAVLDMLAAAFGAAGFAVSEVAQTTFSAMTTLPGPAAAKLLAEALEALTPEPYGVGVFEIEDGSGLWEVGSYFTESPDMAQMGRLAAEFGARPFVISEVPDVDWVAKVRRELAPVEAGRFLVFGSHDMDRAEAARADGKVTLQIEATVAFGTGHHGTTLGCLRAFDSLFEGGFRPVNVADIGCGTAVLALAAAAVLPEARILASDIDKTAVAVAQANATINEMSGRILCIEAAGFQHPDIAAAAPFDLIFANILKGPLVELAPSMARHCAPAGRLILSGLLAVQADGIVAAYHDQGFVLETREDLGEWSALVMKKK